MSRLLIGSLAGLAATVPMTAFMQAVHRRLPRRERYALEPHLIAANATRKIGVRKHMNEQQRQVFTLAAHYGYGASMGAVYAVLSEHVPLPPVMKGVACGLAVWSGSYLGWLPAAGLLSSAIHHPIRRTALTIGAHVIWGATLGILVESAQDVNCRWNLGGGTAGGQASRAASKDSDDRSPRVQDRSGSRVWQSKHPRSVLGCRVSEG